MDRLVPGVEQMLDVDRRLRRPEPEALVRLVPDQPVANPGVATGGGRREAAEVSRARRREVRRASAVRPRRRPDEREHRRQPVAAKAAQNPVRPTPVVGAIARRGRILRPPQGDLVPVEREADERHAEPLERRQPLVERPRAELQPRVVLDPVLDAASKPARSSRRRRPQRAQQRQQHADHAPGRPRPARHPHKDLSAVGTDVGGSVPRRFAPAPASGPSGRAGMQ